MVPGLALDRKQIHSVGLCVPARRAESTTSLRLLRFAILQGPLWRAFPLPFALPTTILRPWLRVFSG
jgi:hypothetical protein